MRRCFARLNRLNHPSTSLHTLTLAKVRCQPRTGKAGAEGFVPNDRSPAAPGHAYQKPLSAHAFLWSACAVVVIWLAATATWIVGDPVVPCDSKNQFYAFFRF